MNQTSITNLIIMIAVLALAIIWLLVIILWIQNRRESKLAIEIKLESLFKDKNLVAAIANNLAIPISQAVTQEQLDSVTELKAEYRQIEDLTGISALQNLEKLNVNNNQVTVIPDEISKIKSLKEFRIAYNQLNQFEPQVASINSLEKLDVSGNKLQTIDAKQLGSVPLKEFVAVKTGLSRFPMGIQDLGQLELLNLSHNKLTSVPKEVAALKKLTKLNLAYNSIPDDIEVVQELLPQAEIDLSNNTQTPVITAEILTDDALTKMEDSEGAEAMSRLVNTYIDLTGSNEDLLEEVRKAEKELFVAPKEQPILPEIIVPIADVNPEDTATEEAVLEELLKQREEEKMKEREAEKENRILDNVSILEKIIEDSGVTDTVAQTAEAVVEEHKEQQPLVSEQAVLAQPVTFAPQRKANSKRRNILIAVGTTLTIGAAVAVVVTKVVIDAKKKK